MQQPAARPNPGEGSRSVTGTLVGVVGVPAFKFTTTTRVGGGGEGGGEGGQMVRGVP